MTPAVQTDKKTIASLNSVVALVGNNTGWELVIDSLTHLPYGRKRFSLDGRHLYLNIYFDKGNVGYWIISGLLDEFAPDSTRVTHWHCENIPKLKEGATVEILEHYTMYLLYKRMFEVKE